MAAMGLFSTTIAPQNSSQWLKFAFMHSAQFKFHGRLADFLPPQNKALWITYSFANRPAIKDAIEAMGVPHVEIGEIILNGQLVSLSHSLVPDDRVEAYPIVQEDASQKFVLDVHLGKLARLLRLLGFDTQYQNNYTDKEIVVLAQAQQRVVLTRDVGLLKHKSIRWGYWLRSQQPMEQAREVIYRFALNYFFKPFTRCLSCNGLITPIAKEAIASQLLPNTFLHFSEFYQCQSCKKIYWKGSHYEKMLHLIEALK